MHEVVLRYKASIRARATGKADTVEFLVWPEQVAEQVASSVANSYGAEVEQFDYIGVA